MTSPKYHSDISEEDCDIHDRLESTPRRRSHSSKRSKEKKADGINKSTEERKKRRRTNSTNHETESQNKREFHQGTKLSSSTKRKRSNSKHIQEGSQSTKKRATCKEERNKEERNKEEYKRKIRKKRQIQESDVERQRSTSERNRERRVKEQKRISKRSLVVNLKEEREALLLSRDQVSQQAEIPLSYVTALETGIYKDLPRGQKLEKYKRRYLRFLEISTTAEIMHQAPSVSPRRMGFMHTITTGSFDLSSNMKLSSIIMSAMVIIAFIIAILKFASVISEKNPISESIVQVPSAMTIPNQNIFDDVRLRAIGHSNATIHADGELVHEGKLEPMKYERFSYEKKLVVEIENIGMVEIHSNGRKVWPQGNLQGSRQLVFVRSENDL